MSVPTSRPSPLAVIALLAGALAWPTAAAAPLPEPGDLPALAAPVEAGWRRYVSAVDARRQAEVADRARRFLVLDHLGGGGERQRVLAGEPVIVEVPSPGGVRADLDDAQIHHWRGAVFVPGATVARLVAALEAAPPPQPDVLRARVLGRGPDGMRVYLRIRRSQVVTVVYDTEHLVRFRHLAPGRALSTSDATRIVEVADAGTASEHLVLDHEDRDFLWRLTAFWRYQDVPGGVIAECESVSLSRDVPFGLGLVARPFIHRAAESSMRAALLALRE